MIRSTSELYEKFPWMKKYPNMAKYILQFGTDDLIPIPWAARDIRSAEKIYKKCIKKGIPWRELLDWNADKDKDIIL